MAKWLEIVRSLIPTLIALINPKLAPLGGIIAGAIVDAEQIPGASGSYKLAHAKNIAIAAATAVDDVSERTVVDLGNLDAAITDGINTAVAVANLLTKTPAVVVPANPPMSPA